MYIRTIIQKGHMYIKRAQTLILTKMTHAHKKGTGTHSYKNNT